MSPGLELVAFVYRNSPVCIFESSTGSLISWAVDNNNRVAEQVIFNPNPEVSLLLVAYNESHLALYDPWSGSLVGSAEAESHVILNSVTCSPDGRTFAAIDVRGHLRIWDFESLTLLYHVLTPNDSFGLLQFTSDGLGLIHVVKHEMRVWAPSALVRKTVEEEASLSDQSPVLPVTEGQFEMFQSSKIKTVIAHSNWPVLFAGKHNGDVVLFQASDGYCPSTLYSHNGVVGRCLASNDSNIVASADIHGHV
jgi:WD40 repeat protein